MPGIINGVLTSTMPESFGCKVILACDGSEAVTKYKKNKQEIDLVILDMVMPGSASLPGLPIRAILKTAGYSKENPYMEKV